MKDFNIASKAPCIWTIILKKTRAWFWSWCSSFCSLQDSAFVTANEIGLSHKNVNNNKSYLQPQTVFLSFCTDLRLPFLFIDYKQLPFWFNRTENLYSNINWNFNEPSTQNKCFSISKDPFCLECGASKYKGMQLRNELWTFDKQHFETATKGHGLASLCSVYF